MNAAALSPVLVALARSGLTGQPVPEPMAAALNDIAWDDLASLAHPHGLSALVGAGARVSGLTPPPEVEAAWRHGARIAALREGRAWDEIGLILGAWRPEGIEPIFLKGVLLGARHYPAPGLRPFGDIDLLVPDAQRDAAVAALLELGYQCTDDLDAGGKAWCLENHFHWKFMRTGAFPVELHWSLTFTFPPTPADLEVVCRRAEWVDCPAGRVRALGPVDEALALAAHVTSHCFHLPLRCHADFAAILPRFTRAQWSCLWERAEEMGQGRDLRAVLGVGRALGFLHLAPEDAARVDADRSLDVPFLARYAAECPFVSAPERWLDVRNAPSPQAALVRLYRVAFPRYTHLWTPQSEGAGHPARIYAAAWGRRTVRLLGGLRDLPKLAADCRRTARVHRAFGDRRRRQ